MGITMAQSSQMLIEVCFHSGELMPKMHSQLDYTSAFASLPT